MLVDGRKIAGEIYRELKNRVSHLDVAPHLTVFTCAPNFETQKFLALKKRKAEDVGIAVNVVEFPYTVTTAEVQQSVERSFIQTDGVIVQLPFPASISIDEVLAVIPPPCDVDVLQFDGSSEVILPPVVGAIAEIVMRHSLSLIDKNVVVVGDGRLVGTPAAVWFKKQEAKVTILTKETEDRLEKIAAADILVLGVGQAKLITPDMVKAGVVIFDAGTSEDSGALVGDADPVCAEKSSLFTPVPGGIGPITVAVLLRNLVELISSNHGQGTKNMI